MKISFPITLFCLISIQLNACPHCNIHNYLASSVLSSPFVFEGEVDTVTEALNRGKSVIVRDIYYKADSITHQVGDTVIITVSEYRLQRSTQFIICAEIMPRALSFPILDTNLRDEIKFLAKKDSVSNFHQAWKLVMGISGYSNEAGRNYLVKNYKSHKKELFSNLDEAVIAVNSRKLNYVNHSMGSIIQVVDQLPDSEAFDALRLMYNTMFSINQDSLKIDKIGYRDLPPITLLLNSYFDFLRNHKDLKQSYLNKSLNDLKNQNTKTFGQIAAALLIEDVSHYDQLKNNLSPALSKQLHIAALIAARYQSSWWQRLEVKNLMSKLENEKLDRDVKKYKKTHFNDS